MIWFFSSFGVVNGRFGMVDDLFEDDSLVTDSYISSLAERMDVPEEDVTPMDASLLASAGNAVSFVFKPLGFGSWKPTVATVTGLVAKEEVVGTFGVLYNYDAVAEQAVDEETGELLFDEEGEPVMAELSEEGDEIWDRVAEDYTPAAAFAFMIFNLLCAPCFAAIGAIKREMNNAKWTWAAIGWMTVWAYILAFIVYNTFGFFAGDASIVGFIIALVLIAVIVYMLVRKGYKPDKSAKTLTSVDAARA